MAIDFPASPTNGQVFNAAPGVSFVYSASTGWTRPASALQTALPKNYLVNPAMQISEQNGNNPATGSSNNWYMADQWSNVSAIAAAGASLSVNRTAAVTPSGSPYRLSQTLTAGGGAAAANDLWGVTQRLEGQRMADLRWGTADAVQVVFRFGLRTNVPGTYSIRMVQLSTAWVWLSSFVVPTANVDAYFTKVIPGPVAGQGTWSTDSTIWGILSVYYAAGSSKVSGPADTWRNDGTGLAPPGCSNGFSANGNNFQFFDAGLYADPYKTGVAPPFVLPEFSSELRRCQRYWYKCFGIQGVVTSATVVSRAGMRHPVPMRSTPAGPIVTGTPKFYDGSVTPSISSFALASNAYAAEWDVTVAVGGMTAGRTAVNYYQSDNDFIGVSARM